MKRALVIWFFVAALVAMGCSPPPDSFGSVGTLQDSWIEIWDWYDLDAVRNNLSGSYVLMTDLDSTSPGYGELAGPTANGGAGWEPIGIVTGYWLEPFVGTFNGQGYEIRNLLIDRPNGVGVGLFGLVNEGGVIEEVGVANSSIIGAGIVGGLVGWNAGGGTIRNSYYSGSVTGDGRVGGLLGYNHGIVRNSHYDYEQVLINGQSIITVGALFSEDFQQWHANNKFLDVNERLSERDGCYLIEDISDFKELLAFGQADSLRFRLEGDIDLSTEPNFYIPYFAGEFDGAGHMVASLSLALDFVTHLGLFGFLRGDISDVGAENVAITSRERVGGLVGCSWGGTVSRSYSTGSVSGFSAGGLMGGNWGTVSNCFSTASVRADFVAGGLVELNVGGAIVTNCYSTGNVEGDWAVGGLVGLSHGTVCDSYSTSTVFGRSGYVGGLIGRNEDGTVNNCYSTGNVGGGYAVGGLVGENDEGTVTNSFWDTETAGVEGSDGGTGKTTAEMKDIVTFTDTATEGLEEAWDMIAVATGETDPAYTWNIVNSETYPFLTGKEAAEYALTISSTLGGSVTVPGEDTFMYDAGSLVNLVATPVAGYGFISWSGDVDTIDNSNSASTTITMNGDYSIVANFEPIAEVQTECVESTTGTGEVCFTTSHGLIEDLQALPVPADPPDGYTFPDGLFSFKITGLASGQTVTVTIELPSAVPAGTKWWKHHDGQWHDYNIPITISGNTITITLTDGGVGDLDDVPGQITDPGGPGYPLSLGYTVGWETRPINKVAVMAPWIGLLAAIAGASLLVLRRRQTQS